MIDSQQAWTFARAWIEAWNRHDLESILEHYRDDVWIESPLVVQRLGKADGRLQGKEALRSYWLPSLALDPPLVFELMDVLVGVDSVTIHYRNRGRRVVAETLFLDTSGRVARAVVHWSAGPDRS
jgi:ketosteroid isomerase-like protein